MEKNLTNVCECGVCSNGSCECTCHPRGCTASLIAKIFVLVGGISWGLIGLGGFLGTDLNIVHRVFGSVSYVEWGIYVLVGVSSISIIIGCRCSKCTGMKSSSSQVFTEPEVPDFSTLSDEGHE